MPEHPIDRRALVDRHNPVLTGAAPATEVLTVGNGDCALTVDVTGLQTMPGLHALRPDPLRVVGDGSDGLPEQIDRAFSAADFQIPIQTQSSWGWYSSRPVRDLPFDEAVTVHATSRGEVPYPDRQGLLRPGDGIPPGQWPGAWHHFNPRRAHLGRLALLCRDDPRAAEDPAHYTAVRTTLDLWTGTVTAEYAIDGIQARVRTVADPHVARFAVRIESDALREGWSVGWVFDPQADDLAEFEHPLQASTRWRRHRASAWTALRCIEDLAYEVDVVATGELHHPWGGEAVIATTSNAVLDLVVTLRHVEDRDAALNGVEAPLGEQPGFAEVEAASRSWWGAYWQRGAMVSLEGSSDPRAGELERRIVLSQQLTAVLSAGSTPPAETGLVYNSWSGKFHLEMHWWHAAHFALWGRGDLLERSLGWYHDVLPVARRTAQWQGFRGARWPKQTDPSGKESPSSIGVFLLWQQPHIIHLLELLVAEGRSEGFLELHYPLVEATADFMTDAVEWRDGRAELPPPLIPAQESYLADRETTRNPTFELAYWSWALTIANRWRERLGLPRRSDWEAVATSMRRPSSLEDGTYAAVSSPPYLIRKDHPSMLMALGWLPPSGMVETDAMRATLDAVWESWDFSTTWGWDYPVMAMTSARLGDLPRAFDALLHDSRKNRYLANGHCPQMPGFLTLYLPANGGLLAAVAHIAAAEAAGVDPAPGWTLRAEGFVPLLGGDPSLRHRADAPLARP